MKQLFTIIISLLLLTPSLSSVFIYLNFKANQEEIVKNLCVQREMKVNNCNGHCFLSKQLLKAAEKEKKEAENLKEKLELVYTFSTSENKFIPHYFIEKTKILIMHFCGKSKSISLGIFHPPLA